MRSKVGLITIGQSPRSDITPDLELIWGNHVQIVEKGALDGLSQENIGQFHPAAGEYTLITRMRDGSHVIISKKQILSRMQEKVNELNQEGVRLILLLCTGEFPELQSDVLIVKPQTVLHRTVFGLAGTKRVGILTPLPEQVEQTRSKWLQSGVNVEVEYGSPYGREDEMIAGIKRLSKQSVDLIVLDCMGYSLSMKSKLQQLTTIPLILPRTLIARIVEEII